jgi:hypothetical protein
METEDKDFLPSFGINMYLPRIILTGLTLPPSVKNAGATNPAIGFCCD